ncbi:Hypothetical predicted protein [Mytilus galloprovincialis]|uniref:Reverse transcriptase domain-containing protein n=1 Tax=Mytilus galloprovincialis TaxID=29158 RepID=A0A8B6C7S7_MYTGA|nr:Hypothetical predicted protein [Mytilus galloprovincialis]
MGNKFVSKSTQNVRKPRPIIVKFIKRQQRDTVLQISRKLKESTISISEQFPKAIHEKRKLLFPVYQKAKEAGKRVSFNKDKLFIDGEQTVVKSNKLAKITRRDQSGDRMSDTASGPGFSVAEKTPSVSSIKPSKSSVSDGSSSGSRFEVLADMHTVDTPETVSDTTYDELDQIITQDEILKCISNLKRGKSHGIDGTFNELFIEFKDILLPFLEEIFNKILASGHFPKSWALAVLIPVFKKGDSSDPSNYRGISLVSNLAKLFTSIINSRLIKWSENNDIIQMRNLDFARVAALLMQFILC